MENKVRSFIRLIINRELTNEELGKFFDVVDESVLTDTMTTFNDDGEIQDETAITLIKQGNIFIYEVPTIEDAEIEQSHRITEDFSKIISDDFEIATTFS